MSEGTHTPGPWSITSISQETGNIGVGHRDLRIVIAEVTNAASFADMLSGAMSRGGGGFSQDDCHTQFANARLIAAAPEMLEALKAAKTLTENMAEFGSCNSGELFDAAWTSVRAAIAKAEAMDA